MCLSGVSLFTETPHFYVSEEIQKCKQKKHTRDPESSPAIIPMPPIPKSETGLYRMSVSLREVVLPLLSNLSR
jgi:hypothetical protein